MGGRAVEGTGLENRSHPSPPYPRVPFCQDFPSFPGIAQSRYPGLSRPVPPSWVANRVASRSGIALRLPLGCPLAMPSVIDNSQQFRGCAANALLRPPGSLSLFTGEIADTDAALVGTRPVELASTGRSGLAPSSIMAFAPVPRRRSLSGAARLWRGVGRGMGARPASPSHSIPKRPFQERAKPDAGLDERSAPDRRVGIDVGAIDHDRLTRAKAEPKTLKSAGPAACSAQAITEEAACAAPQLPSTAP